MSDRDIQREIEANERRARDEQDVGLEEDALRRNDDGTFLDDALDDVPLIGDNESEKHEAEYGDDDDRGRFVPE